jgi:hypothetical protein
MPSQNRKPPARKGSYKPQLDHDGDGVNGGSLPKEASTPADVETVDLGGAEGRLTLVPVDLVLSLLDDGFKDRIERQRTLPSTLELHERVRATEGRCAPIIFTQEDPGDEPSFFDGAATLAAAINLSLERVAVVIIDAGDAGAVQSHQVRMLHAAKPAPSEDDELMWRVIAES